MESYFQREHGNKSPVVPFNCIQKFKFITKLYFPNSCHPKYVTFKYMEPKRNTNVFRRAFKGLISTLRFDDVNAIFQWIQQLIYVCLSKLVDAPDIDEYRTIAIANGVSNKSFINFFPYICLNCGDRNIGFSCDRHRYCQIQ